MIICDPAQFLAVSHIMGQKMLDHCALQPNPPLQPHHHSHPFLQQPTNTPHPPRSQAGIPEFIQNLGYVGGFSPSAFQLPPESQAPLQILGLRQDTEATYSHADEHEMGAAAGRRGLNTVLEQWLGDVLGAGGVGSQGGGGGGQGGGGQGGRWS